MSFGISHDTAEFSCDNFKYYWNSVLQGIYSHATTIMLLCDGGGSNSSSSRLFKQGLIRVSKDLHVDIIVTLPPLHIEVDPIEPWLFSQITRVWSGISLESGEQARELAAETRMKSDLCAFTNIIRKKYDTSRCVDSNMTIFVNGILPLIKSTLNGTTSFHGEIKNTKLIFKRYLIVCSVSRTDFSLSHAVISYNCPHTSAFPKAYQA